MKFNQLRFRQLLEISGLPPASVAFYEDVEKETVMFTCPNLTNHVTVPTKFLEGDGDLLEIIESLLSETLDQIKEWKDKVVKYRTPIDYDPEDWDDEDEEDFEIFN